MHTHRCELLLASLVRQAAAVPHEAAHLAHTIWQAALNSGETEAAATSLVAQALICCWLAPAVGAPQAFGVFPEPSPHANTCNNLDAISRELMRLPAAMRPAAASVADPCVVLATEFVHAVLLSEPADYGAAAACDGHGDGAHGDGDGGEGGRRSPANVPVAALPVDAEMVDPAELEDDLDETALHGRLPAEAPRSRLIIEIENEQVPGLHHPPARLTSQRESLKLGN